MNYPIAEIRKDFPVFKQTVKNKPLVFLDTAASAQKPSFVIDNIKDFYETSYANIHRGLYTLSQKSSTAYEQARIKVKNFINAKDENEIIFTKNTTESINLVANSLGKSLQPGDEIIISQAEHHANIIPWFFLKEEKGVIIKWLPINDDGSLKIEEIDNLITDKTKIVAITYLSNVLGILNPIEPIINKAHQAGAMVIVDGCQAAVHTPIDVQSLNCDFFVMSSHKLYGPSGVGVLYGKKEILAKMPPYQGGGGIVKHVDFDGVSYLDVPSRFEAGTPAIAEAVGLGFAIDYINKIGVKNIQLYEESLSQYMENQLATLEWLNIIGTAPGKSGIYSFYINGVHPQDIAMILNQEGVAIRTGHHCAEPLHRRLDVPFLTSARASIGMYNTKEDIDIFITALKKMKGFF